MDAFFEIVKSILMGIVQGITEWLPVSSTAHLSLLDELVKMDVSEGFFRIFEVVIQVGSILAVLVLYFNKLNPWAKSKTDEDKKNTLLLWVKVAVASIPAAIVGLLIDDWLDSALATSAMWIIAATLFIYGVLFLWMENRKKESKIQNFEDMSFKTALLIGVFQMLALIPGTSRSGSTILGATVLGTSRVVAAEFSFFMAIPVMFGASGLKLFKAGLDGSLFTFTGFEWLLLVIGLVVSFLVSLVVIRWLIAFVKKHSFKPFGWYRMALAVVIVAVETAKLVG